MVTLANCLCNDLMYLYCFTEPSFERVCPCSLHGSSASAVSYAYLRITVSYAQSAASLRPAAACQSKTPPPAFLQCINNVG